jgi:hypothetical protein
MWSSSSELKKFIKVFYPGTQRIIQPPATTPPSTSDRLKNGTRATTMADEDWPVLEAAAPLPDLEPEAAEDPLPVADAAAPEVVEEPASKRSVDW